MGVGSGGESPDCILHGNCYELAPLCHYATLGYLLNCVTVLHWIIL